MGWFWFIPTFHILQVPSSTTTLLTLTRKEIDFPIGIGHEIIDVNVSLEWMPESDTVTDAVLQPAVIQSVEAQRVEDAKTENIAEAVATGGVGMESSG